MTIQKGHYKQLKGLMELDKKLDAPIKRGDVVGRAIIKDGNKVVLTLPLLALDAVDEGSFWTKMTDSVKKLFSN